MYSFVHDITHKSVRERLPLPALAECASAMLNVLDKKLDQIDTYTLYRNVVLLNYAKKPDAIREQAPKLISALIAEGAFDIALQMYNASVIYYGEKDDISIYIQGAEILWHLGEYREALNELNRACCRVCRDDEEAIHNMLRGKIYLRLNEYKNSFECLDKSLSFYKKNNDGLGELRVYNEINTILRDLERYDDAESQARQMLARADLLPIPTLLYAQTLEATARSLAFTGKGAEGIIIGEKALEIARKNRFKKTEGNAHLAIAECFRHQYMPSDAIYHYREACGIARDIANRDSFIWSALGLSDSYLLDNRANEALATLELVGLIVRLCGEKYPLEYRHWNLSVISIEYLQGKKNEEALFEAAYKYDSLSIRWPHSYCNDLAKKSPPKPKRF